MKPKPKPKKRRRPPKWNWTTAKSVWHQIELVTEPPDPKLVGAV